MKAIILSAGQGSRLGHLVDERPKCLIDFNGRTLLDRQLDTLEANEVHEAVVVTGFRDECVEEALARRSGGPAVRTIYNPFYKVADNTGHCSWRAMSLPVTALCGTATLSSRIA